MLRFGHFVIVWLGLILSPRHVWSQCSPAGVSGVVLWLKASEGLTFQTGTKNVSRWQDVSGCGFTDLSNSNTSNQPLYVEDALNHWPVIQFDGSNDVLTRSGANLNVQTIFIVTRLDSNNTTQFGTLLSNGNDQLNIRKEWASREYRILGADVNDFINNAPADSNFWVNGTLTGINPNGWHVVSAKSENTKNYQDLWIGNASSNFSRFWQGGVAELIMFNADLSDADRIKIEKYLGEKYQIPQLFSGYDDWSYSMPLQLNTTSNGVNVLSNVTDYPLYLKLDNNTFDFSQFSSGGQDFRVTDGFGNALPLEIQSWDDVNESAAVWIKTDVTGNANTQTLYLYWGNPEAVSLHNPSGVFPSVQNYGAVWHLETDPPSGPIIDNTNNNNTGYLQGSWDSADLIDGPVGKAFNFKGSQSVVVDNSSSINIANFTVSAWVRTTQTGQGANEFENACIFDKDLSGPNAGWFLNLASGSGRVNFSSQDQFLVSNTDVNDSSWHLVSLVKTNTQKKIYIDGNLDITVSDTSQASNSNSFFIGARYGSQSYFVGGLDEIRIENANRGDDWNRLYYQNIAYPALLYSLGASGNSNRPEVGYTESYVIPAAQVVQKTGGLGTVEISFKIVDSSSTSAKINLFSYSVDGGVNWKDINGPSNVLPADFFTKNWQAGNSYATAPVQSFNVTTKNIPEMVEQDLPDVRFRLQPKAGQVQGFFAISDTVRIDNEYPSLTIPKLITPDPDPSFSGTADELLSLVLFVIDGDTLGGNVVGSGFNLPDNSLGRNLDSGVYAVTVIAFDVFGNRAVHNGSDELTINSKAPLISVDQLLTNDTSPPLSGTVNDTGASILVEVDGNSYPAENLGDGTWVLSNNTISSLQTGIYDVVATATNQYGLSGSDGTNNELEIDADPIVIETDNLYTNSTNPNISGTINDLSAQIELHILGEIYTAQNNGDGTWLLNGDLLDPLPEDSILFVVEAGDSAGNTGSDSSAYIIVDLTAPELVSISPNQSLTVFRPNLQMEFDEDIFAISEEEIALVDLEKDSIIETIVINDSNIQKEGTKGLSLIYSTDFEAGKRYGVRIGDNAIQDRAGNSFAGFDSDSTWSFTIADSSVAFLNAITSSNAAGIYKKGDSINLNLEFNQAVTLKNGSLNLILQTGTVPDTVSLDIFDLRETVSFNYVVQEGDSTKNFNVLGMFLDSTAQLLNAADSLALLDIPRGSNVSDFVKIVLDAKEFILTILKPETNKSVRTASVGYEINKDAAWGRISWINGIGPNGEDLENQEILLTSDVLSRGVYEDIPLFPNLVSGGIYTVFFEFRDFSDNSITGFRELIEIEPPNSLVIDYQERVFSPSDTLVLRALGLDLDSAGKVINKDTVFLTNAKWDVIGEAELIAPGVIVFKKMEHVDVIATVGALADTVRLYVTTSELKISNGTNPTFTLSPNLTVVVPTWEEQKQITIPVNIIDSSEVNMSGLRQAGYIYKFENVLVEAMDFRFLPDTSFIRPDEMHLAQLYCWPEGKDSRPILLEVERKSDERLVFQLRNDSLGIIGVAIDEQQPTANYKVANAVSSDSNITFTYILNDNIQNYKAFLVMQKGGFTEAPMKTALDFENNEEASVTIKSENFTEQGLSYWIEVWDGLQYAKVDTGHLSITMKDNMDLPSPLKNDEYIMFSIPQKPVANKVKNLLVPDWGKLTKTSWRLYEYDEGFNELSEDSRLVPGKSYFVNTSGFEPQIEVPGGSFSVLPLNEFLYSDLNPEWNTIAVPFSFKVPLKKLREFNRGQPRYIYELVDEVFVPLEDDEVELDAWSGYLFYNGPPDSQWVDSLIWRGINQTISQTPVVLGKKALSENLSVQINGKLGEKWLGAVRVAKSQSNLKFALPSFKAKKEEMFIDYEGKKLSHLESSEFSEGLKWNLRAKLQKGQSLNLNLVAKASENPPHIAFWDEVRSGWTELGVFSKEKTVLLKNSKGLESLQFFMGSPEWIKEQKNNLELASSFFIAQNFPNPFTEYTRFQYGFGWEDGDFSTEAQLKIFNLKGKLIKEFNLKGEAGKGGELIWNGKDQFNQKIPSGTYFYQFVTPSKSSKIFKLVISR